MSILRASATVSGWTGISRILGFLRDVAIASKLGASATTDAFFVALMLPNLLRRLLAEGAFNVAFVPLLARSKEQGTAQAQQLINTTFTMLFIVVIGLVVLAEILMPWLVRALAPGFADDPIKLAETVYLGRITFPYLALITVAAFIGSVCNTWRKFAAYAAVPALLNISFLTCLFTLPLAGISPVLAATIAVPIGGVLQAAFMLWALRSTGLKLTYHWNPKAAELKTLLHRLGPAALGVGVLQVSFMIDNFLASFLYDNAISYLQYANRFYQLPLALIGIALATVLLPHFSQALSRKDDVNAAYAFNQSMIGGLTLALAAMVGLFVLANELMATLFEHGKFTPAASTATAGAMMAYCIGLPGYILTKITSTAFFAHEDTKTPVKAAAIALGINFVANLILMQIWGHIGIALATAIAGWSNAIIQFIWLKKQSFIAIEVKALYRPLAKALAISLVMAAILFGFEHFLAYPEAFIWRLCWLLGAVTVGMSIFAIGAQLTGLFPLRALTNRVLKRGS